jgi:uncharacterized membrane protein
MTSPKPHADFKTKGRAAGPFRRAVVRGLGILMPPLLTIVIFLWVGNTVNSYLLEPLENGARWVLVEKVADIRSTEALPAAELPAKPDTIVELDGEKFRVTGDDKLIPAVVYDWVRDPKHLGKDPMPTEAKRIYARYVDQKWLQPAFVIPVFLCLFILVLYLLGKFLAAGVGQFFWTNFERLIQRTPFVRGVYSAVKQFSDFFFSESELPYTRVVSIEYPRPGMWTLAFATGEGMADIRAAAGEPVMTIFIPTSPMPLTGYALTVKRSEVIDMNISIDQAIQFLVSCGVVIPPVREGAAPKLAAAVGSDAR